MDDCKEFILGPSSIQFIRDRLSDGLTLSKYILESIDLGTGQVITILPEDTNPNELEDFGSGILPFPPEAELIRTTEENGKKYIWAPKYSVTLPFVRIIRSFLESGAGRLCIIENASAIPTHRYLLKYKSHFEPFQNEIYHLLYQGNHSEKEIEQTINEAMSAWPQFIGAMTSLAGEPVTQIKRGITHDILKELAERTEKLIIGAYDGEGFLIWNKI